MSHFSGVLVPFSQFGIQDEGLYKEYVAAFGKAFDLLSVSGPTGRVALGPAGQTSCLGDACCTWKHVSGVLPLEIAWGEAGSGVDRQAVDACLGSAGSPCDSSVRSGGNMGFPGISDQTTAGGTFATLGNTTRDGLGSKVFCGEDPVVYNNGNDCGFAETVVDGGRDTSSEVGRIPSHAGVIGFPRGSNFQRNHENRLRKKAAKMLRQAGERVRDGAGLSEWKGKFSELGEEKQKRLLESHWKRLVLENETRIADLEDVQAKRRKGLHHVEQAMKLVRLARSAEKDVSQGGDLAKVSSWAGTIATSSSVSIAKASSVGSRASLSSLDSKVSASSSVSVADVSYSFRSKPPNSVESLVIEHSGMREKDVVKARKVLKREVHYEDLLQGKALRVNPDVAAVVHDALLYPHMY